MNSRSGFLGLLLRQRLIRRWAIMRCSQTESVMEHSAVVVQLCILLYHIRIDLLGKDAADVDLGILLSKAALHDSSEVLSSDIVTPVKNANEGLKREFQSFENSCKQKLISTLPKELSSSISAYFEHSGGIEDIILKGADIYAALLKARLEIAAGNQIEFGDAYKALLEQFDYYSTNYEEFRILEDRFGRVDLSIDMLLSS